MMGMSAGNGTTVKIVALVAVIALCIGAFAGVAFAYTAITVDTIPEQKVGSVFITVNSEDPVTSYGSTDDFSLDVNYNTMITKVDGKDKIYYRVADGTVVDTAGSAHSYAYGFTATVDNTAQTVTFEGCIAEINLKAYGKDASGTLKVYGLLDLSTVSGLSDASHYYMKDGSGNTVSFTSISSAGESYYRTGALSLTTTANTTLYVMASFTVSTLNLTEKQTALGTDYYAPVEPIKYADDDSATPIDELTVLDDITIAAMSVVYKFETAASS